MHTTTTTTGLVDDEVFFGPPSLPPSLPPFLPPCNVIYVILYTSDMHGVFNCVYTNGWPMRVS